MKADFDCEGSVMAGKMVPLWQQYSTCPRLLFYWFNGKSRITGLALQLWTLLRFILLEYIITTAGPLKHTSTSASVVWAPCMTFLSWRCALYCLQKINQNLHLAQHKKPISVFVIIHSYVFPAYSATYNKATRRWWISDACHHAAITVLQLFLVPAD